MPASNATPKKTATRPAKKAAPATPMPESLRRAPQAPETYEATSWGLTTYEITVPSGQTCLLQVLDIQELLREGLLDVLNGLRGIVGGEVIPKANGQKVADPDVSISKMLENPQQFTELMDLLDKVTVMAVVAPKIWPIPPEGEEKQNGRHYVDKVPFEDKMFIFNDATGGVNDLVSFRAKP